MDFKTIFKDNNFTEQGGVFYFGASPKEIKPSKDENAQDQSRWSYWRKKNYEFFKEELGNLPKNSVLVDLGAGQSDFLDLTSKFNLCAVDFYPYLGINVVCDLTKPLPFGDNSVDILMLSNLIEHIPEPNLLFVECRRILKPGGVALGTVPFMINIHQRPYDFYRYTEMNLDYLFKKHNFENISIKPVLATYIVFFNALTSFFVGAIRGAKFPGNLILRILWKLTRIKFKILTPVFKRFSSDPDMPLGYLFKAQK